MRQGNEGILCTAVRVKLDCSPDKPSVLHSQFWYCGEKRRKKKVEKKEEEEEEGGGRGGRRGRRRRGRGGRRGRGRGGRRGRRRIETSFTVELGGQQGELSDPTAVVPRGANRKRGASLGNTAYPSRRKTGLSSPLATAQPMRDFATQPMNSHCTWDLQFTLMGFFPIPAFPTSLFLL
ncbi:uncharacterized protein LOC132013389 isoform X1 [Mustela nigripes]|uniref:uncharacterized protein LOC132013389 isoform X1 n=1 Tax=Mustela nigripes TaxID=77151 RepID=UPI002814D9D7|nr:uncharacterized protein LOC132013389 isoform X1 [Mustela nigripes]